jgi:hypothetical protein
MTLDRFLSELRADVERFERNWRDENKADPEAFPLEFPADNAGGWWEQFMAYRDG